MDPLDPSILLDRSRTHTFVAHTGSASFEFFELGAGIGKLAGRTGYVPWPIVVGGLSLSAVPVQASYHGETHWQLTTDNIRLAEALISFNGVALYVFVCSTLPIKRIPEYQQGLYILRALGRLVPQAMSAYDWFKSKGDSNSIEIRLEGAMCGQRVAYQRLRFRDAFKWNWSTPQAAIGFTSITFGGLQWLNLLLQGARLAQHSSDIVDDFLDDIKRNVHMIF